MIKQIGGYAVPVVRTINGRKFTLRPVIEELSNDIAPNVREKILKTIDSMKSDPFEILGIYEKKRANGDVAILINRDAYNIYRVRGNMDRLMIFKPDGTIKVKSSSLIPQQERGADVEKYTSVKTVIKDGVAVFKKSLSKIFVNKKQSLLTKDVYTPEKLSRYQLSDNSLISRGYGESFGCLGNFLEKDDVVKREFENNGKTFIEYSQVKEGNYLTPYDAQF